MNWAQLLSGLFKSAHEKKIPLTGTFELTPRCNLSCKMCYINLPVNDTAAQQKELPASEWIRIGKEAKQAGMLRLLLTGGEVLVRDDFRQIYEGLSELGFLIQIYTNGTLITPEIAKWLGRMPPSQIGVTLYGANPESYEQVCGNKNAYIKAVRGVEALVAEGLKPQIRMTIIQKNVQDFLKLLAFADDRGLLFAKSFIMSCRRDGQHHSPELERLTPEMVIDFIKTHQVLEDNDEQEKKLDDKPEAKIEEKLENKLEDKPFDNSKKVQPPSRGALPCGGGYDSFWINWYGGMTFCGDIETPCSFPFRDGFDKAWEDLHQIVDQVPYCDECVHCKIAEHCIQCPGRLMNETGSFERSAPYFCEYAKLLVKFRESSS